MPLPDARARRSAFPPAPMSPAASRPAAAERPDEAQAARDRLLQAGLRLFALQGFAKTSTRELADAAQVNVAAISYYFGDKAGLYRAVFHEPMGSQCAQADTAFADPALDLREALQSFFAGFLEPLKHGDLVRLCMKLHFREHLEPTGLWDEHLAHGIRPLHEAMLQVVCRHLGLAEPDADAQRLVVALAGLGVHLHVGYDINEQLAPGLMQGEPAVDLWRERLVTWGQAMVRAEAERRAASPSAAAAGGPGAAPAA